MEYSEIFGYHISKLTLGTAAVGMKYGISNASQQPDVSRSVKLLREIAKQGINMLDTARTYGHAEQLIGQFLSAPRQKAGIHVVTKFKISAQNIGDEKKAGEQMRKSLNLSRQMLGLDRIPVFLFHMDRGLPIQKVIPLLASLFEHLKKEGLIHLAGVSIDHPGELPFFLEQPFVDALQVPVNLLDMRLLKDGTIERLQTCHKLIFARSVFLQGLIFMQPDQLKGNLRKAIPFIEEVGRLAYEAHMSIAELAFSYVKDIRGITSIVFGAVNEEQVRQNIALLHGKALDAGLRDKIHEVFLNVPEEVITPGLWQL